MENEKRGEAELILMVINVGAHWSPLELVLDKRDKAELIQMVIIIGAHWSPFELILVLITIGAIGVYLSW